MSGKREAETFSFFPVGRGVTPPGDDDAKIQNAATPAAQAEAAPSSLYSGCQNPVTPAPVSPLETPGCPMENSRLVPSLLSGPRAFLSFKTVPS